MRFDRTGALLCLCFCLLIGGCAPVSRVVLLPQADSSSSAVVVRSSSSQVILDVPYQRASTSGRDNLTGDFVSAAEVRAKYLSLFTAAPQRPIKYILNFLMGGTALTSESEAALPRILADIARRAGADLVVTGHTDTIGALETNDALSLERAEVVTQVLMAKGVPAARIESAGRGKRELLVKTDDNVDEPKNRRVEIVVR